MQLVHCLSDELSSLPSVTATAAKSAQRGATSDARLRKKKKKIFVDLCKKKKKAQIRKARANRHNAVPSIHNAGRSRTVLQKSPAVFAVCYLQRTCCKFGKDPS